MGDRHRPAPPALTPPSISRNASAARSNFFGRRRTIPTGRASSGAFSFTAASFHDPSWCLAMLWDAPYLSRWQILVATAEGYVAVLSEQGR